MKEDTKDRVLKFLFRASPEEYNAKTLASVLKLKYASIRQALTRLAKEGKVIRTMRGFYRAPLTEETVGKVIPPELKAHGIKIQLCHNGQAGSFLRAHQANITKTHAINGSTVMQKMFENKLVTITVHNSGLMEIWLSATDDPIDYEGFTRFCAWLEGMLGDIYIRGDPRLIQIGLNYDMEGLEVSNLSNMKVQKFRNAWSQMYHHNKDRLRVETHMTTDLKLEDAINIMKMLGPKDDTEEEVKKRLLKKAQDKVEEYAPPPEDHDSYMYG
jgi:hypothetical protein